MLLQRFLSTSVLANVVHYLRKTNQINSQEAGLIQEVTSQKDKVHLLVEVLSATDPNGAALQAYLQKSHPTEFNLISVHGKFVYRLSFIVSFLDD